jgi:putative peptidoglycan lipid II flippase
MIPVYVIMRQSWGAIGLAIASAIAIIVYVLLLGWLQYRRFTREAALKGSTLENVPGMLDAAVRLAVAAAIAICAGLLLRAALLQLFPDTQLWVILMRAIGLCLFGVGTYVAVARMLGVRELAEVETIVLRRLTQMGLKRAPE